jgi:hypothetical protein
MGGSKVRALCVDHGLMASMGKTVWEVYDPSISECLITVAVGQHSESVCAY